MKIQTLVFLTTLLVSQIGWAVTLNSPEIRGKVELRSDHFHLNQLQLIIDWTCLYDTKPIYGETKSCGSETQVVPVLATGEYVIPKVYKEFPSQGWKPGLFIGVRIKTSDGKVIGTKFVRSLVDHQLKKSLPLELKKIVLHTLNERAVHWRPQFSPTLNVLFDRYNEIRVSLSLMGRQEDYFFILSRETPVLPNLPRIDMALICGVQCPQKFIIRERFWFENKDHHFFKIETHSEEVVLDRNWPERWSELVLNDDDSLERSLEKAVWSKKLSGELEIHYQKFEIKNIEISCQKGTATGSMHVQAGSPHEINMPGTCGERGGTFYFAMPFALKNIPTGDPVSLTYETNSPYGLIWHNGIQVGRTMLR